MKNSAMARFLLPAAFLIFLLFGSGCAKLGSSAMRIEIDVYKGPLSNTVGIQKGQLAAITYSANLAVKDIDGQLEASMCRLDCVAPPASPLYYQIVDENYKTHIPDDSWCDHHSCDDWPHPVVRQKIYSKHDPALQQKYPSNHNSSREFWPTKSKCDSLGLKQRGSALQKPHQICPVYQRMRLMLGELDENSRMDKPKNRGRLRFTKVIDQARAISDIEETLLGQLDLKSIVACDKFPDKDSCNAQIASYAQRISDIKTEVTRISSDLKDYIDRNDSKTELLWNPGAGGSLAAFISFASQLQKKSELTRTAVKESLKAIENLEVGLQSKREIGKLAIELNNLIVSLKSFIDNPLSVAAFAERKSTIEPLKDESNLTPDSISDWKEKVLAFQRELDFLSKNTRIRTKRIGDFGQYLRSLPDDEALGTYVAQNSPEIPSLEETQRLIVEIENRFKSLNALVSNKKTGINTLVADVGKDLSRQRGIIAEFDQLKATLAIPADRAQKPSSPASSASDLQEGLKKIAGLHDRAATTAWGDADDSIKTMLVQANTANKALEKIITADTWQSAPGTDSPETGKLDGAINVLKALSLPAPKISQELAAKIGLQIATLEDLITPSSSEKSLAQLLGEQSLGVQLPRMLNETKTYHLSVIKDGLSLEESALLTGLFQAKQNLGVYRKSFSAATDKLGKALDLAKTRQATNDISAYSEIAMLAASFRILATAISYQLTSVTPSEKRLRIDMIKAANMAAEFANQLTARANALSIQAEGTDRHIISTGQYLRDTQPTAFLDAFAWLDAATDGDPDRGGIKVEERISVSKRLFADDNWARINQVYASGVGKTSMAFIRDAIGNWNLKSFENDPSQLTKAYSDLSVALLKKAASKASGGLSSLASANELSTLINSARDVQSGGGVESADQRSGALISGLDLTGFRRELINEMATILSEYQKQVDAANQITECSQLTKEIQESIVTTSGSGDDKKESKGCPPEAVEDDHTAAEQETTPATDPGDSGDGASTGDDDDSAPAGGNGSEESDNQAVAEVIKAQQEKLKLEAGKSARTKAVEVIQRYKDLIVAFQRVAVVNPKKGGMK